MRSTQRKQSQRQRMLSATIDVAARHGYQATTIGRIVAQAGVSRPTFYDYFPNRDSCLLATVTTVNEQVLAEVTQRVDAQPPEHAAYAAVEAIFDFCVEVPTMARFLVDASLAGPAQISEARSDGIAAIARAVDDAYRALSAQALVPDIESSVLIAGILRLLGLSLRRDATPDRRMLATVLSWIESYAVPAADRRWMTLRGFARRSSHIMSEPPFGRPPVVTQHDFPGGKLEYARQRLLFAAGQLSESKGFGPVTLAAITARARVNYRVFRRLFASKGDLFVTLLEIGSRRTLATTFSAYFDPGAWPERVWAAGRAYTQFVASNPTIAHVGFVDSYASGPRAAEAMDKTLKAFTLFLADGDGHVATGRECPPQLARDAIAATIFDLGYAHCRSGKSTELTDLLPQAVFIALTPYLGPDRTLEFIDSKLAALQGAVA